ncbi:ABC transporter permease [Pelomonas sp. SE-A7]|uniref:ABC transporter permease n=1 Tax=Pelomonas sp. SE-A7 TaxID=3054953 RepID=UPI00259D1446|nr:ABC transporter permease [Pelomonas sp. SE-A7]MDM4765138.1 ABC transporter permease [Pelomonas sp. SE-A7]
MTLAWRWLRRLSLPALRQEAWRPALALLAVVLGVGLAYGVHLINSAALAEFGAAARSVEGRPDLVVRPVAGGEITLALFEQIAASPGVAVAAPVIEAAVQARDREGLAMPLKLLGVDLLQQAQISPELMPRLASGRDGLAGLLDPQRLHLNAAALRRLPQGNAPLVLRHARGSDLASSELQRGGQVAAAGTPLAVIDIAGAQALLGRYGLDRIELRLLPGVRSEAFIKGLALPAGVRAAPPADSGERIADLSRAYRVNLGVLSLMALFTGSFLVFAVIALSVARRLPQLALLGVLGLSGRERAGLVLGEAALLGSVGATLGLLLGWGLAAGVLRLLGGDFGAGLGLGNAAALPPVQPWAAAVFGGLGLLVCVAAAAVPAWGTRQMAVAQVLKGLGGLAQHPWPAWLGPVMLLGAVVLALLPPIGGLSLGAYAAMLLLLLGGLAVLPQMLRALLAVSTGRSALALLARRRLSEHGPEAMQTLAGVLVALALSVAMLVMVGSFRSSLIAWLDQMLPAELYVRSALRPGTALPEAFIERVQKSGIARRIALQRSLRAEGPDGAPMMLLAREIVDELRLPLVGTLAEPPAAGQVPLYVNESLRDQGAEPGKPLRLTLAGGRVLDGFVRGVWRDYSRQSPAVLAPLAEVRQVSGDPSTSELLLWLPEGGDAKVAVKALRAAADAPDDIEIAEASDLRALSLKIFDRSFVLTHGLQAVVLAIGLFGVAASQSAQTLARRREFGLLRHLGLTRRELLSLLAREAVLLAACGALLGLALGLAISAVLVFVLNPQSFHWSMDLHLPWTRLALLIGAMFATAVGAALLAGRQALSADAVQSVKEDW